MATKAQMTGMLGVYLVAAELTRLGFIVSTTSRNAQAADILVTDQSCLKTYSVQVKTNAATFSFWLMGSKAQNLKSKNLIYVLVNLKKHGTEYYVVPSKVVARQVSSDKWHQVNLDSVIKRYKARWDLFGSPT